MALALGAGVRLGEAGPSTAAFMGSTAGLRAAAAPRPAAAPVRLQTECASSRAKKSECLELLKKKFDPETAMFVATVNYKGMTVKDFETFRKKLPQGVELIVAKNTLVEKAIEGTKFAPLKAACKGTNAFLFAGEEVAGSIKTFNEMSKALKKAKNLELQWNGAVMDGSFVDAKDVSKLESMPTKKQLIGKIAGSIKQITTKIPLGLKQVTAKVAYGAREIADGKSPLIKA